MSGAVRADSAHVPDSVVANVSGVSGTPLVTNAFHGDCYPCCEHELAQSQSNLRVRFNGRQERSLHSYHSLLCSATTAAITRKCVDSDTTNIMFSSFVMIARTCVL